MFQTARLRLTIWYLTIISIISILFSGIIYRIVAGQITGFIESQNHRLEHFQQYPPPSPTGTNTPPPQPPFIDTQTLLDQKRQLLLTLIWVNLGIIASSGLAGYFLAGKTLQPIKRMVDDQNQFITDASHELRTPLTTLRAEMEASLLEKHLSDQQTRHLITSNLEDLSRLQSLANKLLKLTHLNSDQIPIKLQPVSVNLVINTTKQHFFTLAQHKQIKIVTKLDNSQIIANKDSLIELLSILVDNAIKYSLPQTQITLSSTTGPKYVKITIADQGIGISSEDLPHIFERFYRADKSRSLTDGHGLGLSIAKKIVTSLHGSISAKPNSKSGTTFTLRFPKA